MEWLEKAVEIAKNLSQLAAAAGIVLTGWRVFVLIRRGQMCLLRTDITRTYYRNLADKKLRQYEFENVAQCYEAYKAMGGNSFVEHIYKEMQEWEVIR